MTSYRSSLTNLNLQTLSEFKVVIEACMDIHINVSCCSLYATCTLDNKFCITEVMSWVRFLFLIPGALGTALTVGPMGPGQPLLSELKEAVWPTFNAHASGRVWYILVC